jgi:hypothetical protein
MSISFFQVSPHPGSALLSFGLNANFGEAEQYN